MKAAQEKKLALQWQKYTENIRKATPINIRDTAEEINARKKRLEAPGNREAWIKYYFDKWCFAEPAKFQIASSDRIEAAYDNMVKKGSGKFRQSRPWFRGASKSSRRMMEMFYLIFVKKFPANVLLCSKSEKNAAKLLKPYIGHFEANQRIIQDYGKQQNLGSWTSEHITTLKDIAFTAVGRGQSPRGAKEDELRINCVLLDDIDDDELCRNPDLLNEAVEWVEEAVIPCVEISKPYFIFCDNNLIAEDSIAMRLLEKADDKEIVNIRDENGKSSWPEKNTEEMIDDMINGISYASSQKEYFNNPMSQGKTFPEVKWGKCPPISDAPFIVTYADPAPSNKDRPGQKSGLTNSRKAVFIMARIKDDYYIYYGFLDVMSNSIFMASMYECRNYIKNHCDNKPAPPSYYFIENNTLQDPFYEQVLLPLMYQLGSDYGGVLPISPDIRKKPEKWPRIESALEPINRLGHLIFNIDEKDNPHMQRLEAQFIAAKPTSKQLDGPDAIEGAKFIIDEKQAQFRPGSIMFQPRERQSSKYGY